MWIVRRHRWFTGSGQPPWLGEGEGCGWVRVLDYGNGVSFICVRLLSFVDSHHPQGTIRREQTTQSLCTQTESQRMAAAVDAHQSNESKPCFQ